MNQRSLLAHVAPSLTTQFENLATESLLYLLEQDSEARVAFVDLASTVGYVGLRDLTFDTQVHMEYGSIPDLVGATEEGTNVLLVESKFWAPLTPNQPAGYLRQLPQDREGMACSSRQRVDAKTSGQSSWLGANARGSNCGTR